MTAQRAEIAALSWDPINMSMENNNQQQQSGIVRRADDRNVGNPFERSSVITRSPPSTVINGTIETAIVIEDKGVDTPLGRCPVKTPTIGAKNQQDNGSGNKNVAKLGDEINQLLNFLKGRTNVHKEIVSYARRIQATYIQVVDDLGKVSENLGEVVSADKDTQTEQEVSLIIPSGTPKRRRDPLSPKGNKPKKKKEGIPQKQTRDAIPSTADIPSTSSNVIVDQEAISEANSKWVKVPPKSNRRMKEIRRKPVRPDALIIHTCGETSYADILRKVKSDPKLERLGQNVKNIRKTVKGELLLELNKSAHQSTVEFRHTVEEVLGTSAEVRSLSHEVDIEIRDIDEVTSKEEVYEALVRQEGELETLQFTAIKSLRRAYGGTQIATVGLSAALAARLIKTAKIRIGWVVCRIREKIKPRRCFKCMDYGHTAANCKSPNDYTNHCLRCGENGHKIKTCEKQPMCLLCSNTTNNSDHVTGAFICPYYREALQKLLVRK